MRNHLLLALALPLATVGRAADAFDSHVANMALLQAKPVQTELKVTDAQRKRMNDFAKAHENRLIAFQKELEKKKTDPRTVGLDHPRIVASLATLKKDVFGVLTAAQLRRLREISLQQVGFAAIMDDKVATRIGLTGAARKKARDTFLAGQQRFGAAQRKVVEPIEKKYRAKQPKDQKEAQTLSQQAQSEYAAAIQKARPELTKIEREERAKLEKALTAAQRKALNDLRGKPFRPK